MKTKKPIAERPNSSKTLIFPFLFILLIPIAVQGQHRVTEASYNDPITKTIVKKYRFPATISYVETKGRHYFAYSDSSMTIVNCEIDKNLFVLDFVVSRDVVYFCGYDTLTQTKGVWGKFNTNDLIQGNLSYETYSDFVCGKAYADTLNSLVAYGNNGVTTIVTVGTANSGTSKSRGCTIEITPSGTNSWNYTMGVTPDTNMENTKHVCLTDNYIITSGFTDVSSSFEVYRRHNRSNIFATAGPQDFMLFFPTSNDPKYTHPFRPYAITHIGGDTITATLSYKNLTNPGYGVIVKTYDMSNPVIGLTNSSYVYDQSTQNDLLTIRDLKYDRINNRIVLLLYGNTILIPNLSSIVAEIPMTPLPTTYQIHHSDEFELTSLDLYNGNHSFLCQGFNQSSPVIANYFTQPLATTATCATTTPLIASPEVYIIKGNTHPYTICNDSFKCTNHKQLSVLTIQNNIICKD